MLRIISTEVDWCDFIFLMQYNGWGGKELENKFQSMQEAALAGCEGSKQKLLPGLGHGRRWGLHLPQTQCGDLCTEHPRKARRMV